MKKPITLQTRFRGCGTALIVLLLLPLMGWEHTITGIKNPEPPVTIGTANTGISKQAGSSPATAGTSPLLLLHSTGTVGLKTVVASAASGAISGNVAVFSSIAATPNSLALGTVALGTAGPISTYDVSGSGLGAGITITPPVGVEVSRDGFAATANTSSTPLTLAASSGEVALTTISVRLIATATAGAVSGTITNVSGAAGQSVAVSGAVTATATACLSDGFESTTFPATGWVAAGVTRSTTASDVKNGGGAAIFDAANGTLTTLVLAHPSSLSFYLGVSSNTAAKKFKINVSTTSQTTGFAAVRTFDSGTATGGDVSLASGTASYNPYTVDLSAYSYSPTVYIQFEKASNTVSPFRLDDVAVGCGGPPPFTLTTGTIAPVGPFCVGLNVPVGLSVPYTVSGGTFGTGNVFTAYLSKDNFATKLAIGTVAAVASGTISASIAQVAGLTTATTYRIRVEGSTPTTPAGTDNGTDLAVSSYLDNETASATALAGNGQATFSFTAPANCVSSAIATIRVGSSAGPKPLTGTAYAASPVFGVGTQISSGQYVVYNGAATGSVTVTGLTNGTLYQLQVFTTGGSGYSNGVLHSVRPVVPATLTEVLVPQFISGHATGSSTHATRLPYVWRVALGNLAANTTYKYYTAARAPADPADYGGVGIPVDTRLPGAFVRHASPTLTNSSATFTTDASGSYTGWFGLEPGGDSRFSAGNTLNPMVVINAGGAANNVADAGDNVASQFLATNAGNSVTALLLAAGGSASGVRGTSFGTPGNFVFTYDNPGRTGRPLAGTWLESDGSANVTNYAGFYASVEAVPGAYGLLTPSANPKGILAIEQRSLTTGAVVGCVATDADGTWPGGANTASLAAATALVLTTGDTPFAAPTVLEDFTATAGIGGSVTINGTNFPTGPRPSVSFNGGPAVPAAGTSATTLTVAVPAGATSGPLTVTTSCGAATTTSRFIVLNRFYYTKAAGEVNLLATYGDQPNGSGAAPASFTADYQSFVINGTNRAFTTGDFVVSGTNSRVIAGVGASLIIPPTGVLAGSIDQQANSVLIVQNPSAAAITALSQGAQDATSTIDLAQTGATPYALPPVPAYATSRYFLSYANLKLTGGLKRLGGSTAAPLVVAGGLTFDNTQISGSVPNAGGNSPGDYPTFLFGGDFTQLAGTTYDAAASVIFQPSSTSTVQSLNANGGTLALFSLSSAGSTVKGFQLTGAGSVLQLGNAFDGGFALADASTSLALDAGTTLRFAAGSGARFSNTANGVLKPDPGANIDINRGPGNPAALGTLPLAAGFQTVNNFTLNTTASPANSLSLGTALTVSGTLSLQAGTLMLGPNTLTLNGVLASGTGLLGGSSTAGLVLGGSGALAPLGFASGARTLGALTLNRPGARLLLTSPLTVGNSLTLTSGFVTSTAANLLTLAATAGVGGGSDASFVNGPVARPTTAAVHAFFPVGKGAAYRPITLAGTQTANSTYTAEQFEGNPGQNVADPLKRVSYRRYFTVQSSNTTADNFTGQITLSFGADDFVNVPGSSDLVVAKRDLPAAWASIGRSANTAYFGPGGTPVSGTLTSGPFSNFSDFALGALNLNNPTNPFTTPTNPLPVELTSFYARRQGDKTVAVAWATASEKNSAYFEVQRSPDGRTFAVLATVAAQGTSTRPTAYAYLDKAAPAAPLYYRLRQLDTDGSARFSPIATVPGTAAVINGPALYPNPARASLTVQTELSTPYRVYNQVGQLLLHGTTRAGATHVALNGLAPGLYFLELQTATGRIVRKFEKE